MVGLLMEYSRVYAYVQRMNYRVPYYLLYPLLSLPLLSCHKAKDAPAPKPSAYRVRAVIEVRNFRVIVGGASVSGGRFSLQGAKLIAPNNSFISDFYIGWHPVGSFDVRLGPATATQADLPDPTLPAGHTFNVRLQYSPDRNQLVQYYGDMSFKAKVLKRDAANPAAPEETVVELDLPVPTTPGQPGEQVFITQDVTL